MAKGALNVVPAAGAWWTYEGRHHVVAYGLFPLLVGAAVLISDREIDDWGSIESGLLFLTGLLMTSLFQVFQWGRDAIDTLEVRRGDPHERGRQERRLQAVERTYRSIVWATLVALALSVTVIVLNTKSGDAVTRGDSRLATIVVGVVGTHLAVVLVAIVNRIFIVTRSDLKHVNDEVRSQRHRKVGGG